MSEKNPLVSIIITTYNRPDLLQEAIDKCLIQSYDNLNILVVDHSGRKYAESIVKSYNDVDYFGTSEELGQIQAWNKGFKKVSGDFIQLHDDDDWMKPSKINKQVNLLNNKENTGVAYCGVISEKGEVLLPNESNKGDVTKPVLKHNLKRCQTTTMLIDSSLLDKIMPLYEFGNVGDLALQIKLCQETNFDYVNQPLVRRFLYHNSSGDTIQNRKKRFELLEVYSEIYENYPEVKRKTLISTNNLYAKKLLTKRIWSTDAIISFYKIIKYKENPDLKDYNRLIFSFFGRPGFRLGEKLYRRYFSKI